ncbi:MAG: hypothetical protein V4550_10830 [Gemmatimonadota bacterium]
MADPHQPSWRFLWYITEAGASEVFDYVEELRDSDFTSYSFFLDNLHDPLLSDGPFALPKPYWEDIGDGFSEISWGRNRIYCCIEPPRRVFALVAVEKRWQAFASKRGKYVRLCEQRRADIRSGAYDEKKRNEAFHAHRARRGKT